MPNSNIINLTKQHLEQYVSCLQDCGSSVDVPVQIVEQLFVEQFVDLARHKLTVHELQQLHTTIASCLQDLVRAGISSNTRTIVQAPLDKMLQAITVCIIENKCPASAIPAPIAISARATPAPLTPAPLTPAPVAKSWKNVLMISAAVLVLVFGVAACIDAGEPAVRCSSKSLTRSTKRVAAFLDVGSRIQGFVMADHKAAELEILTSCASILTPTAHDLATIDDLTNFLRASSGLRNIIIVDAASVPTQLRGAFKELLEFSTLRSVDLFPKRSRSVFVLVTNKTREELKQDYPYRVVHLLHQ